MAGEGPIVQEGPIVTGEHQYICDYCGKKKPVSQIAGKCCICKQIVCHSCATEANACIYCPQHAPKRRRCFIATAAYGTPFAKEINVLRKFRDNNLQQSSIGRSFIDFYYLVSPPIAKFISPRPWLRRFVRSILNPLVTLLKKNERA